jgi:hypothetical protein
MLNYLCQDNESGELFFVQCADETERDEILLANGFDLDEVDICGVYTDGEAEILGYDTY